MSQIDNIIIQVRARLQSMGIKLWLEPYYYDEVGCVEDEIEVNITNDKIFGNKLYFFVCYRNWPTASVKI